MAGPASNLINLRSASILLVDSNEQGLGVLTQAVKGFGAKWLLRAQTFDEAKKAAENQPIDLIVCEGAFTTAGRDGYDFVHWLRRSDLDPNAFTPVIITCGHTSQANVERARDCGANFILAKPIVPQVLLERILWIARDERAIVQSETYAGPDRRFKNDGPPQGTKGRRSTDLSATVSKIASQPNMDQDEIDNLLMPKRVSI
jgi:DNA-binding response OmpR family regulator